MRIAVEIDGDVFELLEYRGDDGEHCNVCDARTVCRFGKKEFKCAQMEEVLGWDTMYLKEVT